MMKSDEKVENVRPPVRRDQCLGIRMILEELNMAKETIRQILTTNLNIRNVCAKMVPMNTLVFSQKNKYQHSKMLHTHQILPHETFSFPRIEKFTQRNPMSVN
jgi:hypothetical protein